MARAYFRVGDETIELLGPRAEQLASQLELSEWRGGKELAQRISAHVADGQPGEDVVSLDEHERRELLNVLAQLLATSKDEPPAEFRALHEALRRSVSDS